MRSSSIARVARRRTIVGVFAAVFTFALLLCGVAVADSVSTDFEGFTVCSPAAPVFAAPCTVNGQDGWKSALPGEVGPSLPIGYDQQVVNGGDLYRFPGTHPAPASFGAKSLRLSNGYNPCPTCAPPEFEKQTYSKPAAPADAGGPNTVYNAQFSFISVTPGAEQPGLRISVSPDNGHGGRMSYIGLNDTSDGIDVVFYDTPGADGDFEAYDLGTLPRNVPHTIRFWIKLNPGPDNDLVRIFIDGRDTGQCFTTWENFYRATSQDVPISDRLLFLSGSRDGNHPTLVGGGYLFDNVTTTTSNGPGPLGCDLTIGKDADAATATADSHVGYQITVRNRGPATARNLQACDRIPRHMTFISADRKLSRVGRRRCFVISRLAPGHSASVHLVLGVDANAPQGTVTNIADLTPADVLSAVSSTPPGGGVLGSATVPGVLRRASLPFRRARALVRVVRRVRAHRPNFTG